MGFIFGDSSDEEADAITDTANQQAAADREAARGAELAMETMTAQDKAARAAADLLSKPQGAAEVDLSRGSTDPLKRASYSALNIKQTPTPNPGNGGGGGGGHGGGGNGGGGDPRPKPPKDRGGRGGPKRGPRGQRERLKLNTSGLPQI